MTTITLTTSVVLFVSTPVCGYVLELEYAGEGRWVVRDCAGRAMGWLTSGAA